ncbi:hypothetical protein C8A00DRAFT_34265 [Chaetomidium leptoderma]|uniref:F-box domain-containing protein n=1 Tax=Chaetomidium leptoderma TaxID=669021 RepID=A0AAN6ZW20_9PEZI|nr:hypothetical protein C8A00DRAFT_34265 [Chaetomidium leptoderma]
MTSLLHRVRRPASAEPQAPTPVERREPQKSTTIPKDALSLTPESPTPLPEGTITTTTKRFGPTLTTLPPEIHLLIAQHLIYPDALSLKHTSRHFYQLVDTGVELKVEWLMERRLLHLECPNDQRCDLGSDLRFCRGSVKLLMQRRREHIECESRPGLGCLIYGTTTCPHARQLKTRFKKWMRAHPVDQARWVLLLASLVPFVVGWAWMIGMMLF